MAKVSLVSLGCAKNLVDSEIMVGHLHQAGMSVVPDADQADVVIVNTCSFIDSSKEESIGHILEAHRQRGLRKRRGNQKLIVAGCMSQRFSKDLAVELHDEVDAFIGLDEVTKVAPIIEELLGRERAASEAPVNLVQGRSTYIPDTTRRDSVSPRGIRRTSRSPKAATTPARSASSRASAAGTAVAPWKVWWRRRASSCARVPASST